ncbi:hypothetical protein E8E12_000235 [Didymella heteroderae]|uniref:Heterokaryon incompatibility domain-containing protein n=1 Tax=Didymella heteroderae TaxID=1769908 RepID=A0A9P4WFT1_9PLEO|nr:hypothetical protein E8E12_000235 [Didymella heteroderae]
MDSDSIMNAALHAAEDREFQFPPLDSRKKQIRLLQIQPSSDSQRPIRMKMKIVHLGGYYDADARRFVGCWEPSGLQTDTATESIRGQDSTDRTLASFTALSYIWGAPTPFTIQVEHEGHIGYLSIRGNLHQYLALRRDAEACSSWFWIDQISIDQTDLSERGHQVGMMAEIYSSANESEIWLGLPFEGSDEAMGFICKTGEDFAWTEANFHAHYPALIELLHNVYWTRVWIVQEVLLSREPVVRVGSKTATWNHHFKPAFIGLLPRLRTLKEAQNIDIPMLTLLLRFPVRHITWAEAVGLAEGRGCTDRRDSIFGLLGLVAPWVQIYPDYSKPVAEVLLNILRKEAQFSGVLPQQLFAGTTFEGMTQRWCRVLLIGGIHDQNDDLDLKMIRRFLFLE